MEKEFTITVKMEERWINHFYSLLKNMENLGNIGSSRLLGFYSDGDGDFRPKFKFMGAEFLEIEPKAKKTCSRLEYIYDAG